MKRIDIETWPRRAAFEWFRDYARPFFSITANLDVTATYEFSKANGLSFSNVTLFHSLEAANSVPAFRTRIVDGAPVEFDSVDATQTVLTDDETISFCYYPRVASVVDFDAAGRAASVLARSNASLDVANDRVDLIYYSVIPWISFTGFTNAMALDERATIPRLVFGRMFEQNGRRLMPHSVEVHHAVVDGVHVGKYFNALEQRLGGAQ